MPWYKSFTQNICTENDYYIAMDLWSIFWIVTIPTSFKQLRNSSFSRFRCKGQAETEPEVSKGWDERAKAVWWIQMGEVQLM